MGKYLEAEAWGADRMKALNLLLRLPIRTESLVDSWHLAEFPSRTAKSYDRIIAELTAYEQQRGRTVSGELCLGHTSLHGTLVSGGQGSRKVKENM